jgi:plastocyanin
MKRVLQIAMWVILVINLGINSPANAVTHVIQVSNFSFTPSSIPNVQLGDVVRWVWVAGTHTTTSSSIPAGAAAWNVVISNTSTIYEYTPTVTGTYNYVCTPHAGFMFASFTVINAGPVTRTCAQSGNWSSSSTWGGNPAPVAGNNVIINGGFSVNVDVANAACLNLQVGGSTQGSGTGTLSFSTGSQLTVSGAVNIGPFNNNNTAGSLNMAAGGTLRCEGFTVNRLGTWNAGSGTIEFTAPNTIPSDNSINFNKLIISAGTTSLSHNLDVASDVQINSGAGLNCGSFTLSIAGNFLNNGTFTGATGTVIFNKNGNQTISGTGINNFNLIRVDEGTSINNTLEVLSSNFNAANPFLTIVNGTFKLSGNFNFSNSFFTGPIYNIQPTSGFWLNNPNATVTAQAGNVSVRGLLRMTAGNYNIGTGVNHSITYVAGSTFLIEGGTIHVAGQLTRNNSSETTSFTQTGGTLSLVEQGSTDPTFAGFDLGAAGSTFTMSGGSLIIRNATSAPSDFFNASSITTVSGGTLQIGDASSANAQVIRIQTAQAIGNILVSGASPQAVKPKAQIVGSSLNIVGNVTIQTGSSFDANGFNITLGGNWSDNGSFLPAGNTVTFNGSGAQSISGSGVESFNNLTINKISNTVTLGSSVTVNNTFNLNLGNIAIGTNVLMLNGLVSGAGSFTSSSTGTVNYNQVSAGQNVLAGNYGNLVFSDFDKILSTTANIGIAGSFSPGAATGHSVTGSTIVFNGGVQTVPTFSYNNLMIEAGGAKTASGSISTGGDLTVSSGASFSGSSLSLDGLNHLNAGTLSFGTISIGTGAGLTNNGVLSATSSLIGAGSLVQGVNATFNFGGTNFSNPLTATATGNTVNYSGTSPLVKALPYYHLTLSGAGNAGLTGVSSVSSNLLLSGSVSATAQSAMSIGGNVTIGSGTSFSSGGFIHTVGGNWSNSGTFNGGTGTVNFNGLVPQTIGSTTFNNLTVTNLSGASLTSDITVNGALNVTSGVLSTGSFTAILGSAGTLSESAGQVLSGNIRTTRNIVVNSGTESFGNIGVNLTVNGVAPGSTTVLRKTGTASTGNGHSSVKRYFDISPTVNSGLNASLVFHYDATELNGQTASLLELYKSADNGLTWTNMGGSVNTVNATISLSNISNFSRWTASDTNNRLGNTVTPGITSINPASKTYGDPAFVLSVTGNGFINGKSTIRFNGNPKSTNFVSSTQLTAIIQASELLSVGTFPVTVFNTGGGGSSNAQVFTVIPPVYLITNLPTMNSCIGNVVVPLTVNNFNAVANIALSFSFNNTVLTYTGYQNVNPALANGSLVVSNVIPDKVQVSWSSIVPASIGSNDTLLKLNFTGIPGTSALTWNVATPGACQYLNVNSLPIPSQFPNGSVVVANCTNISGVVRYDNVGGSLMTNSTVNLKQGGVVVAQTTTDLQGHYSFSNLALGTYVLDGTSAKPWGGVNSADALQILRHFVNLTPLQGIRRLAANVDGSPAVNSVDALYTTRRFVGVVNAFPAGDWVFKKDTVIVNGTSNIVRNLQALCYGDVDGSYVPQAKTVPSVSLESNGNQIVNTPAVFDVPVRIQQAAQLGSISLIFEIPSNEFRVTGVTTDFPGNLMYNTEGNSLKISWYNLEPVSLEAGDVLFHVNGIHVDNKKGDFAAWTLDPTSQVTDAEAVILTDIKLSIPVLQQGEGSFMLAQNFPNPFTTTTEISYYLASAGIVKIEVCDYLGRKVLTIEDAFQDAGIYNVKLDRSDLRSGVYTCTLLVETPEVKVLKSIKMVIE